MRDNTVHLLRDSWQFSFRITEKWSHTSSEKPQFTRETDGASQGYAPLVNSAFLWHVLKIVLGRVISFLSSFLSFKLSILR